LAITAGTKLGRYEIRSQLGAGGMGEVYLAQDAKVDRKVALKILPADVAANRDRMERFVREAKVLLENERVRVLASRIKPGETFRFTRIAGRACSAFSVRAISSATTPREMPFSIPARKSRASRLER
jgi:hypothetical protein